MLERKSVVVVHGSQSHQMNVNSGVPQGPVIGPLLFLVYIDYVVSQLSCKFCFFAEDLKLNLICSLSKSYHLHSHINTRVALRVSRSLSTNV